MNHQHVGPPSRPSSFRFSLCQSFIHSSLVTVRCLPSRRSQCFLLPLLTPPPTIPRYTAHATNSCLVVRWGRIPRTRLMSLCKIISVSHGDKNAISEFIEFWGFKELLVGGVRVLMNFSWYCNILLNNLRRDTLSCAIKNPFIRRQLSPCWRNNKVESQNGNSCSFGFYCVLIPHLHPFGSLFSSATAGGRKSRRPITIMCGSAGCALQSRLHKSLICTGFRILL